VPPLRALGLGACALTAMAVLWTCRPGAVPAVASDPSRSLVTVAAWVAWALAAYLGGCSVVASIAACCHPDARLRAWAVRCSPALVRPLLTAALGTGMSVGLVTLPAHADSTLPAPQSAAVDRAVPGSLDWPGVGVDPRLVVTTPRDTAQTQPQPGSVVVRRGDSLWSIAQRSLCRRSLPCGSTDQTVAAAWPAWWAANRDVVGPDPDLIRPGQRLVSPAPEQRKVR
jgi:LysM repeat protein